MPLERLLRLHTACLSLAVMLSRTRHGRLNKNGTEIQLAVRYRPQSERSRYPKLKGPQPPPEEPS